MTVHVTMPISSLPEGVPHDQRTVAYEDAGGSKYTYVLHPSGALVIYKKADGSSEVDVMYGPSAWERVQGDGGAGR